MAYIRFLEDGKLLGKSFKKDEVSFQTRSAKFIEAGVAEPVNYEEYHKTIKKGSSIHIVNKEE